MLEPVEPTYFATFDRLVAVFRRTREILISVAYGQSTNRETVREVLSTEAMAHVGAILDGLTYLARTRSFSEAELRALVRRAGITSLPPAGSSQALAAEREAIALEAAGWRRAGIQPADAGTLFAARHARVVFSVIPRLPGEAVAWPRGRRTYADIPVPRTEAETMLRAEELARVLWRVAIGDLRLDESLRRTMAFYETAARLSVRGGLPGTTTTTA
jgi:hypothetical protein